MNAVKRCLALIAATLVVGACGGDPTAGDAGADLHIRATPGAVWVRNGTTASVNIEAVDKLGGPVEGSWTVGTIVGPFTVARDTTYQNTTAGALSVSARFVVTPTAEGEGSVIFTGTGGTDSVPVRIAPDTADFAITANDSTPTLFQPITLTAPPGIVFTGGTTIRFYSGPLPLDSANGGQSFPSIISRSADSSQITFVPGPGAHGFARITGIASRSTPGLTTTARTAFQFGAVATQDTTGALFDLDPHFASKVDSLGAGRRRSTNILDTLILTAPANYRFLPSTTIEFFRLVGANVTDANPDGYTVANGTVAPIKIGLSADSSVMRWAVAPGLRGRIRIKNIAFRVAPGINFPTKDLTANTFDQRSGIAGAPDTANVHFTFSKPFPIAEGDSVEVTAPTGFVFATGTASANAGSSSAPSGGDSTRIHAVSPDSTKIMIALPPGANGKFRYSNLARRDIPGLQFAARGDSLRAAAAPAVVASLTPTTVNMNDTVTIVLDVNGPYRFRPTSQAQLGGTNSLRTSISADSLTMRFIPVPGFTSPVTLTNIRYSNLPTFQVVAATAGTLTSNAATSLGPDPIATAATVNAPTDSGVTFRFWDQMTMTSSDPSPLFDGGAKAQFLIVHVAKAGSYTITVDWSSGTDIDIGLMAKDGTYSDADGNDYVTKSGLTSAKPESTGAMTLAVGDYVLALIDFNGASVTTGALGIAIRKN